MTTPFDAGTYALSVLEKNVTVPRNPEQRNAVFRSLDIVRALILGYQPPEPAVTGITIEKAA